MNTSSRGFIVPLLLILIALLIAGGGAYVYTQTKPGSRPVVDAGTPQTAPSVPTPTRAVTPAPIIATSTGQGDQPPTGPAMQTAPISGDSSAWRTYSESIISADPEVAQHTISFRYPDGWDVKKTAAFENRYQLDSPAGDMVTISVHQNFSKIMLSTQNGDILTYDAGPDVWISELTSVGVMNSDFQNPFAMALRRGSNDVYTYDARNVTFTSENGTVHASYDTASGYPVYEIDRPNGDNMTYYFIVPLPDGGVAYVYYFGNSVLPGLEKIIGTILQR